jgi:transcriptional regulator with XRE-family HTH domain
MATRNAQYQLHAGAQRPVTESFSDLLSRHRGRPGLTQRQLTSSAGVGLRSVQDWEAANNYPSAERLRSLIAALLAANGFGAGYEEQEAQAVWDAVADATPRLRARFDRVWFCLLLAPGSAPAGARNESTGAPVESATMRRQDWGDALTPRVSSAARTSCSLGLVQHHYDEDLPAALGLLARGQVRVAPLISDRIPLERLVTDGLQALAEHPEDHLKIIVGPNQ